MTQTRIDQQPGLPEFEGQPPQNNYQRIIDQLVTVKDELFYLRHEWEDNKRDLFDMNELIGRLATKIEEWVGVADE